MSTSPQFTSMQTQEQIITFCCVRASRAKKKNLDVESQTVAGQELSVANEGEPEGKRKLLP